ncbi:peroxidase [Ectocarpus siliculosus]|uniref:Peroxidase n=1 Tax=Ectocarpus siliculosus TaxID=2880 RepID=D7G7J2_ECTSI|nr:peroxidase [Ectocarpus siliculosus]|eukprot:CBJ27734.1 peroxidase [Ectocarpus siliculosus]
MKTILLGALRGQPRELMTDVFLSSPPSVSDMNAVSIAWGQLLLLDLSYTVDNSSEPFEIACDDGGGSVDVWCPLGEASDPIPFFRSQATVTDSVRNPINYASSFIDLDFVYGRSKDAADALRTFDGGMLSMADDNMPIKNSDGTWLIADQRTARFPLTFALHVVLLLEHNRCCVDVAPALNYTSDEDMYQACRGWTIATFQHITEDEFLILLMGRSIGDWTVYQDDDGGSRRRLSPEQRRELLFTFDYYDDLLNPSADVFVTVAMTAAFESALPSTLRIVSEGYVATDYDHLELTVAAEDITGLFEHSAIGDILRGAVLSPAMAVWPHFASAVSNASPLFKLPVDMVQRARDHGVPSYNDVREAYELSKATAFSDVSADDDVVQLLYAAYGGEIENLDACVGALAEEKEASLGGNFGDLLHTAWVNQLYRTFFGDRYHHLHSRPIENVSLASISGLINQTLGVTDLPASGFTVPEVTVCTGECEAAGISGVSLAERYAMSWEVIDDQTISISLSVLGIGDSGMMGIGFGGLSMTDAQDFIICEVFSTGGAECIDRSPTGGRSEPQPDTLQSGLQVTNVTTDKTWTTVTFSRERATLDAEDYDLFEDIENEEDTLVIYAFKKGEGVGQHPNTNRGAATINFVTGDVDTQCDGETNFVSLHGALMLIAWMLIAPWGIYYARYRKGDAIKWAGREWYEMHEDIMIVASEAVLPLGITAVFASRGRTSEAHAHWGYYMIAAVAMQIFTGWMRTKGLEAKHSNFSLLHRFNKHFHIWAGRFAYAAGVVQCYRGLELVSSDDELIFSAGDGLDLQLGSFGWVKDYLFPAWFALVAGGFLVLEAQKQYQRFFKKGAASVCGVVSIVNELHDGSMHKGRLIPRTLDLPIYSVAAFNDKVLSGQSWLMVDEAVLDVSDFAQRHPGGRRLILNALGTDVTQELIGQENSVGHAMSFPPHVHTGSAWRIIRSLVVGYIEEKDAAEPTAALEDDQEQEGEEKVDTTTGDIPVPDANNRRFRVAGKAVMLNNRLALGDDTLATKAMRLNDLAVIPAPTRRPSRTAASNNPASVVGNPPIEMDVAQRADENDGGWGSSTDLLERFQVCPLLFRERMGAASAVGRGHLPSKRPVYRYIFSCPAKAQAQAQAVSGVCYFNMRAQEEGKGVVQRPYNAFAVRLLDVEPPTPGGRVAWSKTSAKLPKVVPAEETTEGVLCIEMRIRMYHDGAMSKLLEKLSKDTDNVAVQLQGPFLVNKLAPPPAHRNVIMIAAGTGVNPRTPRFPRGRGWSSCGRARRRLTSTVPTKSRPCRSNLDSSSSGKPKPPPYSTLARDGGRDEQPPPYRTPGREEKKRSAADAGAKKERAPTGVGKLLTTRTWRNSKWNESPTTSGRRRAPMQDTSNYQVGDGLVRGRVNREILETVFGEALISSIAAYNRQRALNSLACSDSDVGDNKEGEGEDDRDLIGTDQTAGKLQVVVSGPTAFVANVKQLLTEMGVPAGSTVLLD